MKTCQKVAPLTWKWLIDPASRQEFSNKVQQIWNDPKIWQDPDLHKLATYIVKEARKIRGDNKEQQQKEQKPSQDLME